MYSTATCATEATRPRLSTPRFAQSTGTSAAKCWSQRNVWQTISSSLSTAAVFSRTETRREARCSGRRWTSRSRSCRSKARGALPPPRLLRTPERAPDGIYSASVKYLRSQWGCLGGPKIVSIPDPCCDPSAAELTSRTLGPFQTLESLNRFISLGGNDHINRQQTGSGREIRVTSRCQYHCGRNMKRVRVERPGITLSFLETALRAGSSKPNQMVCSSLRTISQARYH